MEFNENEKVDIIEERQDDAMNQMYGGMTPQTYGQYMMPDTMYQYPQNMYRQDDLLPLVLLGLGAYALGDYNSYYSPYYYPPYYNPYYYPPYYNPYYGHQHYYRIDD